MLNSDYCIRRMIVPLHSPSATGGRFTLEKPSDLQDKKKFPGVSMDGTAPQQPLSLLVFQVQQSKERSKKRPGFTSTRSFFTLCPPWAGQRELGGGTQIPESVSSGMLRCFARRWLLLHGLTKPSDQRFEQQGHRMIAEVIADLRAQGSLDDYIPRMHTE